MTSSKRGKSRWIRVSTAARLREVDRQAIYYHINEGNLRTKDEDGMIFVLRDQVMKLKLKEKRT